MSRLELTNTLSNIEQNFTDAQSKLESATLKLNVLERLFKSEEFKDLIGDKEFEIGDKKYATQKTLGLESIKDAIASIQADLWNVDEEVGMGSNFTHAAYSLVDSTCVRSYTGTELFVEKIESEGDKLKIVVEPNSWDKLKIQQLELSTIDIEEIVG